MANDQFAKKITELDSKIVLQQDAVSNTTQNTTSGTGASSPSHKDTWWSTTDAMTISACVLVFGLIVCVMAASLMRAGKSADAVLKTMGTILIIVSSLFLVVLGYGMEQITPIIGLFGTIAGYLLGKNGSNPTPTSPVAAPLPHNEQMPARD